MSMEYAVASSTWSEGSSMPHTTEWRTLGLGTAKKTKEHNSFRMTHGDRWRYVYELMEEYPSIGVWKYKKSMCPNVCILIREVGTLYVTLTKRDTTSNDTELMATLMSGRVVWSGIFKPSVRLRVIGVRGAVQDMCLKTNVGTKQTNIKLVYGGDVVRGNVVLKHPCDLACPKRNQFLSDWRASYRTRSLRCWFK